MPRTLPGETRTNSTLPQWVEEGTTLVPEVGQSLEAYDGGVTTVIVEIEYERVGGATLAAARYITALFSIFGRLPIGVVAVRNIAGTNTPSQHSWGNAVDVMVSGDLHRRVAFWSNANRTELAIAHLLADPYFPSPRGDHFGHVHADFYPQYPL